jgi:hypothetical protein
MQHRDERVAVTFGATPAPLTAKGNYLVRLHFPSRK